MRRKKNQKAKNKDQKAKNKNQKTKSKNQKTNKENSSMYTIVNIINENQFAVSPRLIADSR